jgi:hypothetical protein
LPAVHQLGRDVARVTGLPARNIQVITW